MNQPLKKKKKLASSVHSGAGQKSPLGNIKLRKTTNGDEEGVSLVLISRSEKVEKGESFTHPSCDDSRLLRKTWGGGQFLGLDQHLGGNTPENWKPKPRLRPRENTSSVICGSRKWTTIRAPSHTTNIIRSLHGESTFEKRFLLGGICYCQVF